MRRYFGRYYFDNSWKRYVSIWHIADYQKSKKNEKRLLDPRTVALQKLSPLFQQEAELYKKLSIFFEFKSFEKGEVITKQDEIIDNIFWILDGAVRVTRVVPFISKTQYGKVSQRPYDKSIPFTPVKTADTEEKVVYVEVETQLDISAGEWFPSLPTQDQFHIDKTTLFQQRFKSPVEHQYTASLKTLVAFVPFADFVDLAPESAVIAMIQSTPTHQSNMGEIQQLYLEHRNWESYKKQTMRNLEKDIEAKKLRNQ